MKKDAFTSVNGQKVNWFTKTMRGAGFAMAALAIAAPAAAGQRVKTIEFTYALPAGETLNRFLLTEACPNVGTPPPYDIGKAKEISPGTYRAHFVSNIAEDTCAYSMVADTNTGISPPSNTVYFTQTNEALIDRTNDYGKIGIIGQSPTEQIISANPWGPFTTWSLLDSGTNQDGTGWGVLLTADKRQLQVWHANNQGVLQLPLGQIYTPANVGSELPVIIDVKRKLDASGFHVLSTTPNLNSQSTVIEDVTNTGTPVANTKRVIAAQADTSPSGKTRRWASVSMSVHKVTGTIQLLRAGRTLLGTEPTAIGDYYGSIWTLDATTKATMSTKDYPTGEAVLLPWDILCDAFGRCLVTSTQQTGSGVNTGRMMFQYVGKNMDIVPNTKNVIPTLSYAKQDGTGLLYFLPQRPQELQNGIKFIGYIRDPGVGVDGYDAPGIIVPLDDNNQFLKPVGNPLFQMFIPAAGYRSRSIDVVAGGQLAVSFVKKDGSGDKHLEIYAPWNTATQAFTKVRALSYSVSSNTWIQLSSMGSEDPSTMVAGTTPKFGMPVVPQAMIRKGMSPLLDPNQG